MVEHTTRYSDLRKFFYTTSKNTTFEPLRPKPTLAPLGLENAPGFEYLHPIVSLTNERRSIPDDLALESKGCLLLYQAVKNHETDQFKVSEELAPSRALPECSISKTGILKRGVSLQNALKLWMNVPDAPFQKVVSELGHEVRKAYENDLKMRSQLIKHVDEDESRSEFTDIATAALPMIAKLHEADALPAILFNYDRSSCENIASEILKSLNKAEKEWRKTNMAWIAKVKAFGNQRGPSALKR
jgi:ATP-dependent RNA helicase DDX60